MSLKIFDATRFAPDQLRLTSLPALARVGRWRVEAMRSYRQPVLVWFTRGQGRITILGRTRGYGPHTAVFLPGGTMHGFELSAQAQGMIAYLPRHASAWPRQPVMLRLNTVQEQAELTGQLDSLSREQAEPGPGTGRALTAQTMLLSVWLERKIACKEPRAPASRGERLVRRFTELLESGIGSGQTVGAYAAALGVTPTHLSRVCRAASGRSASAILHDRVIYEARRMLGDTTLPVKDVAKALGYRSAAYFTRDFAKRTGQTPSAFRKTASPSFHKTASPR